MSINGFNSGHTDIEYGVPKVSILGPLLFLVYKKDLRSAIKYHQLHHIADDNNSAKPLSKQLINRLINK